MVNVCCQLICLCSAARDVLQAHEMENISAAKIQQYIQGISGKSDWSVRAWQEWAALEKYLKPQTVAILQKVCFVLAQLRKSGMDFDCVCVCVCDRCLSLPGDMLSKEAACTQ